MALTEEQVAKYFARIGHEGSYDPGKENLYALHREHMLAVPFENLDIHYNKKIALNIERLYEKIVINRRGGFCYELNALFNELLISLGYNTKLVSARVANSKGTFGEEFDHMAIIVKVGNEEFLADVGFGEFLMEPLKLKLDSVQTDERGMFVIEKSDGSFLVVSKIDAGTKSDQYIFTPAQRSLSEFSDMCNYHQTSPESHFTRMKMISLPFQGGRKTLTEKTYKLTKANDVSERPVSDEEEFLSILRNEFSISM